MSLQSFPSQPRGKIVPDGFRHNNSFMKQTETFVSSCFLVLGSYRVELGLYEERKMYLK